MSKGLSTNVSSVLIDGNGVFNLNSDHVIISVKLREITQILKKELNGRSLTRPLLWPMSMELVCLSESLMTLSSVPFSN